MIAIGCDPAGYTLAHRVMEHLDERGMEHCFVGCYDVNHSNYPYFGEAVGVAVSQGKADRGIVICGSGIGISIAANKVPGVRAALCFDVPQAIYARENLDANVLAAGGRIVGQERFLDVVDAFLDTKATAAAANVKLIEKVEAAFRK